MRTWDDLHNVLTNQDLTTDWREIEKQRKKTKCRYKTRVCDLIRTTVLGAAWVTAMLIFSLTRSITHINAVTSHACRRVYGRPFPPSLLRVQYKFRLVKQPLTPEQSKNTTERQQKETGIHVSQHSSPFLCPRPKTSFVPLDPSLVCGFRKTVSPADSKAYFCFKERPLKMFKSTRSGDGFVSPSARISFVFT